MEVLVDPGLGLAGRVMQHTGRPHRGRAPKLESAMRPLSRTEAERILREGAGKNDISRLLHARALRHVESFHTAWTELIAFRSAARIRALRARAEVDLVALGYYLARPNDAREYASTAATDLRGHPLAVAEVHLGLSLVATGADDIPEAFKERAALSRPRCNRCP